MPKRRRLPEEPPKPRSLEEAQQLINELWHQLVDKQRQANRNSTNSSTPSSKNPPGSRSDTRPGDALPDAKVHRKRGAQPGHKGHRRQLLPTEVADDVYQHHCPARCECGGYVTPHGGPSYRHQVFDLPERIAVRMEEHQLYHGQCDQCGVLQKACLPETVSPTQMGPNLLALISTLAARYHLSITLTRELLVDLFDLRFSRGAISHAQGQVSPMLTRTHQAIHQAVGNAPVQYADETGHQRDKEKRWMWLLASNRFAFFMTDYGRNNDAGRRLMKHTGPASVVVSDHYVVYTSLLHTDRHQLCWSHFLRNLNEMAQQPGYSGYMGQRLVLMALLVFRTRHRFEKRQLSVHHYQRRMRRLKVALREGLMLGMGVPLSRQAGRCEHALKFQNEYWLFLTDRRIPLTNNEAERRLRSYVLWRKCCYGVFSHRGEQFRGRIMSFVETCVIQGKPVFSSLRQQIQAVMGREAYPDILETGCLA